MFKRKLQAGKFCECSFLINYNRICVNVKINLNFCLIIFDLIYLNTCSLRNLKLDRQISRDGRRKGDDLCNYDAGLELLERYQNYWTDIHAKTEITALCAAVSHPVILTQSFPFRRIYRFPIVRYQNFLSCILGLNC